MNKHFILVLMLIMVATSAFASLATFTIKTPGASDTTVVSELIPPIGMVNDNTVDTAAIVNGAVTPAKTTDIYSKAEVDADHEELLTAINDIRTLNLFLHYTTATDTVTGERLLTLVPEAVATTTTYPALTATADYVLVGETLSEPGVPNVVTIPKGIVHKTRYSSVNSSTKFIQGFSTLWLVDADGTSNPVFVATSTNYLVNSQTAQRTDFEYILDSDVSTGGVTRRWREKQYQIRAGNLNTGGPVFTVYFGGQYPGFLSFMQPSAVAMTTTGSNASDTVTLKTLTVDKYQLKGFDALTATGTNMFAGGCGNSTTTGAYNFGLGMPNAGAPTYRPLGNLTSGSHNLAIGFYSLLNLTTGSSNLAMGYGSGQSITSGNYNIFFGYESALSVGGSHNIALGLQALSNDVSADNTIALGQQAGKLTAAGNLTTSTDSLFFGRNTRALADSSINEIVIGAEATGAGNNTVTIGSDSIVTTYLKGSVVANKAVSILNSAGGISLVEQPFVAAIDSTTILASFTFSAFSGGEIDVSFNGIKANVASVNIHKKFRVDSGNGTLTITTVASDTWGGTDVLSAVTLVDVDGYSCSLVITGESPNYFSISGIVTSRGSPTSAIIRSSIP